VEKQKGYVTKLELFESQQRLEKGVNKKIDAVDDKVDNLRDMVLPLVESSKQTAKNTERMVDSLDAFTKEQRKTNGKIYTQLNDHEKTLAVLGEKTEAKMEETHANAKVIVAVIGIIGIVVTGIFNLAPILFN